MHESRKRFGKDEIVPLDPPELARKTIEAAIDRGFALIVGLACPVGRYSPIYDRAF